MYCVVEAEMIHNLKDIDINPKLKIQYFFPHHKYRIEFFLNMKFNSLNKFLICM